MSKLYTDITRAGEKDKKLRTAIDKTKSEQRHRAGSQTTLSQFIMDPDAWKTNIIGFADKLTASDMNETITQKFSRGELEQQHGIVEATRLINQGKRFQVSYDSDGESVYERTTKTRTISSGRKVEIGTDQQNHVSANQITDMRAAFNGADHPQERNEYKNTHPCCFLKNIFLFMIKRSSIFI